MEAFIKSHELGRKVQRFRVPELRPYTRLAGGLLLFTVAKIQYNKYLEQQEIELKKARLQMPVYEMKDEDYINPPWSGNNYRKWKYRLIKVSGRQIHVKAMLIPQKVNHYNGYAYFVPVIHSEDGKLENQVGLIVNKGWLPKEYKQVTSRLKIENSFTKVEFVGMLNRGENFSLLNFWKKGNCFDEQRWIWNNFYLKDMAKAIQLTNTQAVNQGVIEVLNLTETPIDDSHPLHYARDMSLTLPFPHPKTLSGALQPAETRSDVFQRQVLYAIAGLGFLMY